MRHLAMSVAVSRTLYLRHVSCNAILTEIPRVIILKCVETIDIVYKPLQCILASFRFLWPCIVSKVWRERKPTRYNNQMFIINFCLNMFQASLCLSSGEQRPCFCIWYTALILLDVIGSGCGALRCRMRAVLASYNTVEARVQCQSNSCGILVDKVALDQVFCE
jgi:hypothetical protein